MQKELANRLKKTVYALARPEGRVVGSRGHERARHFLMKRLEDDGLVPYTGETFDLTYRRRKQELHNIIGVVPGTRRRKKPVLIGAHYDSVIPAPCADDNAAAVAIALEIGRLIQDNPIERDVIIALFDAEEPPFFGAASMGSVRFYEDQLNGRGVHAALIMDLVGHDVQLPLGMLPGLNRVPALQQKGLPIPYLRNLLFISGAESHPQMAKVIGRAQRPDRLPTILTLNEKIGDMSDHGVFERTGFHTCF